MYQRMLIALGGDGRDKVVLEHAQKLARQMDSEIELLRVISIADDGGHGWGRRMQLETGSSGWRRRNKAEAYLAELKGGLQAAGLQVATSLLVGSQSEANEIVNHAAENGTDLIVMASDSRPWYKRLCRPAQDDDVLRRATVPALFIGDGGRNVGLTREAPPLNPVMAALSRVDL